MKRGGSALNIPAKRGRYCNEKDPISLEPVQATAFLYLQEGSTYAINRGSLLSIIARAAVERRPPKCPFTNNDLCVPRQYWMTSVSLKPTPDDPLLAAVRCPTLQNVQVAEDELEYLFRCMDYHFPVSGTRTLIVTHLEIGRIKALLREANAAHAGLTSIKERVALFALPAIASPPWFSSRDEAWLNWCAVCILSLARLLGCRSRAALLVKKKGAAAVVVALGRVDPSLRTQFGG